MLSESARMSSASEARFRVQAAELDAARDPSHRPGCPERRRREGPRRTRVAPGDVLQCLGGVRRSIRRLPQRLAQGSERRSRGPDRRSRPCGPRRHGGGTGRARGPGRADRRGVQPPAGDDDRAHRQRRIRVRRRPCENTCAAAAVVADGRDRQCGRLRRRHA